MRRIVINEEHREMARDFRKTLSSGSHGTQKPSDTLRDLHDKLTDQTHKDYVQKIIDEWDKLIIAEPKDFPDIEKGFESIMKMHDAEGNPIQAEGSSLHELIVDAMLYKRVQSSVYLTHMKKLGVKSCVYCNAQYAFAYGDYINYELDHWRSKSKYPFLSTSFFNLQPCCGKCNKMKGKKDSSFNLYTDKNSGQDLNPFKFSLSPKYYKYKATHNQNCLTYLFNASDGALRDEYDGIFNIFEQYQAHTDIAEELLWKQMIYNSTFQEIYQEEFIKLGLKKGDFRRFIIGNYFEEEDIHKRPLSKLTMDIAQQLGLI